MSTTTIRIDTETRDRLRSLGRMGESYDDVIRQLLEAAETATGRAVDRPRKAPGALSPPLFAHQDRR